MVKIEEQKHTLLVMDDEAMIRELASHMFGQLGFDVETAVDGEETIAMYKASLLAGSPFSAVIMDITVPKGMGGKEAARHILEMDPFARLVVSSGYVGDTTMSDYAESGFSAAIAKPYRTADVRTTLYRLLGKN